MCGILEKSKFCKDLTVKYDSRLRERVSNSFAYCSLAYIFSKPPWQVAGDLESAIMLRIYCVLGVLDSLVYGTYLTIKIWSKCWVLWLMSIIPAAQEAEIREIMVRGQPGQKSLQDPISVGKAECGGVCLSSQWEWEASSRIVVQVSLGKKWDPISKITRAEGSGGVAQMDLLLPSKCKALSSNTSTAKK
jgi:hypothetical protein